MKTLSNPIISSKAEIQITNVNKVISKTGAHIQVVYKFELLTTFCFQSKSSQEFLGEKRQSWRCFSCHVIRRHYCVHRIFECVLSRILGFQVFLKKPESK